MLDFFLEMMGAALDFFVSEAIYQASHQTKTPQSKNGIGLL
jgi:hypothetical protein